MHRTSTVWVRLPFSNLRTVQGICDDFGITREQLLAHNPDPVQVTVGIMHYYVPVEQPGWVDEISLAAAKTIDNELAIEMPHTRQWQRLALIQCRVNDAIQAAFHRQREEPSEIDKLYALYGHGMELSEFKEMWPKFVASRKEKHDEG